MPSAQPTGHLCNASRLYPPPSPHRANQSMEPETSQGKSSPERSHALQPQSSQREAAGTRTARDPVPQDNSSLVTTVWPLLIKKKPPSRHQTTSRSGVTHRGKHLRQASAANVHDRPETRKKGVRQRTPSALNHSTDSGTTTRSPAPVAGQPDRAGQASAAPIKDGAAAAGLTGRSLLRPTVTTALGPAPANQNSVLAAHLRCCFKDSSRVGGQQLVTALRTHPAGTAILGPAYSSSRRHCGKQAPPQTPARMQGWPEGTWLV